MALLELGNTLFSVPGALGPPDPGVGHSSHVGHPGIRPGAASEPPEARTSL